MKLRVLKPTEIEVAFIRCEMAVRYGEEDIPNDFPMRKGDVWDVTIDVEKGQIKHWPAGRVESVCMKVCDQGTYRLQGPDAKDIAVREDDYVPSCIPGRYGDYIDFKIDGEGIIEQWRLHFTPKAVKDSFDFQTI